ncbi:hypothetical protein EBT25_04180 [bacterium]|nr:hypothetical protein [bacterium]
MPELPSPLLPEMSAEQNAPSTPIPQPTSPPPSKPSHGKKRIIFIAGATIVGIGAIAGLGYTAWAGYLPNPLMKRPTAEQMFAALQSINSAKTTVNLNVAIEPRAEDVEPLDFSLFLDKEMDDESLNPLTLQMLPSDLRLDLSITSSFAEQQEGANEETRIQGTYTGNNISANIDLTTRTVEGITYIKPDAIPLPIPILDLSALEGKWIDLENESEEREEVFTYTDPFFMEIEESEEEKEDEKEKSPDPREEIFTLLEQGVKNGAIIFSVPERVTYQDERAWHTTAVINGEKLRETVIAIGDDREGLFPETEEYMVFTDEFIEASTKERARDIYRELFKRLNLSATMRDDGTPLMIALSTRLAPKLPGDLLKDRQITLETEIHFESINIPVNVSAPTDAMTTEEAINLLVGMDMETANQDTQLETVSDIQSALDLYYGERGEYPESLNDLIGLEDEYKKVNTIPNDIFTEKPYPYSRTENGYTLLFEVKKGEEDDTFSFYGKVAKGTNTATELFLSEEGAKKTDEDEDGLSAYDEAVLYRSSDLSTDSDYDGFDDKAEVEAGYNPAGEGALATE